MTKGNGERAERLAHASDRVLETVIELRDLEHERRRENPKTPRAEKLAAEIEAKGRAVAEAAHDESRLALGVEPTDQTIEEIAAEGSS